MNRNYNKPTKKSLTLIGIAIFLLVAVLCFGYIKRAFVQDDMETIIAHVHRTPTESFPNIALSALSPTQQKIITVARQEYSKKPISFDSNVLKYSQHHKESWCADFASWVYLQADTPYRNPNSGSWRIPGVATLQEYYQAQGRYTVAGQYTPKIGDVAIYWHNRSHTNIVIAVHGNTMTTVGGNETGHIRINTQSYRLYSQGLSGFGKLQP